MKKGDATDPKALIAEAYRIDGITSEECRSIFLDWALSIPTDADSNGAIQVLLKRHGGASDHPMTQVLRDGQAAAAKPRRRGGWKARRN